MRAICVMCLNPNNDKVLDVRSNGLRASGLSGLTTFFKSQPNLKVLDLAGNSLGNEGLDAIITSLSPTASFTTTADDSTSPDILDIATAASSRNSSRPTSGRGNQTTNLNQEGDASGTMALSPTASAESVPVASSLEELRLTTNGFGEAPVLRLLNALADSR